MQLSKERVTFVVQEKLHRLENNCIFTGGDFHFYFPDFIIAKEVYLMGLTFTEAKVASVFGDAHPASHVIFLDSHWKVSAFL